MTELDVCSACDESLVIEIEPDSDEEGHSKQAQTASESVLDDVQLSCGCHFHWECFLDAPSHTECPTCESNISSLSSDGQQQVLCTVRNEGGVQTDFDILPSATEHAYLEAYPEERKGHAFLEFCREGDIDAALHLLKENVEEGEAEGSESIDLLRYQGTFEGIEGSGLHVAIRYDRMDIAWLLLVLGSSFPWCQLPAGVRQAMDGVVSEEDRRILPDVRSLKDSQGRTAAGLAQQLGAIWTDWLRSGRLSP